MVEKMFDKVRPLFEKGGRLERLWPLYDAPETFMLTPDERTKSSTHVRDSLDTKRFMMTVLFALVPCILMGAWNHGYQHQVGLAAGADQYVAPTQAQLEGTAEYGIENVPALNVLQYVLFRVTGGKVVGDGPDGATEVGASKFLVSVFGTGTGFFACMAIGLIIMLPVIGVSYAVGGNCEALFSVVRKHEINEGFLVTGILFPLTLPPSIPLWIVAVGIVFGVVIGKEVFGGTGMNIFNPALTARAFVFFAMPLTISGSTVWASLNYQPQYLADGVSGSTPLLAVATFNEIVPEQLSAQLADKGVGQLSGGALLEHYRNLPEYFSSLGVAGELMPGYSKMDYSWWNAFLGFVPGSLGEVSAVAILLGAILLVVTKIAAWRTMVGVFVGGAIMASLLNLVAYVAETPINPIYAVPFWYHWVIGSYAFAAVFMATDPVSSATTLAGKWVYGLLIGGLAVLIRVVNPAYPEGFMLAILFMNLFAPTIDYCVLKNNIRRRKLAYAG